MCYEMVAGLETHIELSTHSKLFCSCSTGFGAPPNTHCCPICTGHPGTLPSLNAAAVERAATAGLLLGCVIAPECRFQRKNYIYPDLPKAYQITQLTHPLCYDGTLLLKSGKIIHIDRIQLEEDAGKLIHQNGETRIDYNRAGIPLIEIVTRPDFSTPEELCEYLDQLILLLRSAGISDCKMQEGQLRCDVNISARPTGSRTLGIRTEIKNMNSLAFIEKAARHEFSRQVGLLASGEQPIQETRRFDEASGETFPMRSKETTHDYRFFYDPDLPALAISPAQASRLRTALPETPTEKQMRYQASLGLSAQDAHLLVRYPRAAAYFETVSVGLVQPCIAARLILGQMFNHLSTESKKQSFSAIPPPETVHTLLSLYEKRHIAQGVMKSVFAQLLTQPQTPLNELLHPSDLGTLDQAALLVVCRTTIAQHPTAALDYRAGKAQAIGALLGAVMQKTRGRADAQLAKRLLIQALSEN